MIFVMMFDERKKNKNRKKTQEERRDLSLSPCFIFYHPPLVFVSSSGLFAANTRLKHTVIIYTTTPKSASSQRGRRSRSEEQRREREREKEREKRERGNLSSLSLFVNPKSNPLTFCALDGSLTAANPGVPFK